MKFRWTEVRTRIPGDPMFVWILSGGLVAIGLALLEPRGSPDLAVVFQHIAGVLVIAAGGALAFLAWKCMPATKE